MKKNENRTFWVRDERSADKLKAQGIEPLKVIADKHYKGEKLYLFDKGENNKNIIAYKKISGYTIKLTYDEFYNLKNFISYACRNDDSFKSIITKFETADGSRNKDKSYNKNKKVEKGNKKDDGNKERADTNTKDNG